MEEWKDIYFIENDVIYDYRDFYQISNYGRIKSLIGNEKILKGGKGKNNYLFILLCKKGKRKKIYIHRLVAHHFVEGYFDGAEVDHIDTDKTNNHVSNLRWCTRKENCNNELSKKHYSESKKKVN